MAILTGTSPISLFTKPDLADRTYLSVNSRQADDSSFNPTIQPLLSPAEGGIRGPFNPLFAIYTPKIGSDFGGVNSFLYNKIIRQSGATRLDGTSIDLGQIRENRTVSQTLWNGFNVPITITNISYSYPGSGVTITAPAEGDSFLPLAQKVLSFDVTLAGSALFDVNITLTFDNGYVYTFNVRGSRLVKKEFTFLSDANWSGGLKITSRYLTSIFAASEVSETRQCLRSAPSREMSYEFGATGKDFTTVVWGFLQGLARRRTYLPLFQDVAYVTQDWTGGKIYCNTTNRRFYANKTVIICPRRYDLSAKEGTKNDTAMYYTALISAVEADGIFITSSPISEIKTGCAIYPAMLSEIATDDNNISVISGERSIVTINLNEVYGPYILPALTDYTPNLFYGNALMEFEWNWLNPPQMSVRRPAEVDDSGRYAMVNTRTGFSKTSISALLSVHSRSEWWTLEGFLDYIKGRYRAFWVKSPLDGLRQGTYTLYDGADLTEIEVLFLGGGNNLYSTQALWLKSSDGTEVITKVTGLRNAYGGGYILDVDPVEISDIIAVKQAFLVRSVSDEIEETWLTSEGIVEVSMDLVELPAGYV